MFLWELLVCGGFSHEIFVCDGFFMHIVSIQCFFMHIVSMRWFFYADLLYLIVFLCILLVCDGFFMHIISFRIIFSMKRGYVYVWGACRNMWVLRVCFLKSKSIQANKCPRLPYFTLLTFSEITQSVAIQSTFAMSFLDNLSQWNKLVRKSQTANMTEMKSPTLTVK